MADEATTIQKAAKRGDSPEAGAVRIGIMPRSGHAGRQNMVDCPHSHLA